VEPVRPARVKVCDRFVTMFSTRSPGSPRFVRALRWGGHDAQPRPSLPQRGL